MCCREGFTSILNWSGYRLGTVTPPLSYNLDFHILRRLKCNLYIFRHNQENITFAQSSDLRLWFLMECLLTARLLLWQNYRALHIICKGNFIDLITYFWLFSLPIHIFSSLKKLHDKVFISKWFKIFLGSVHICCKYAYVYLCSKWIFFVMRLKRQLMRPAF